MTKYVTKTEQDIWGNDQVVTRRAVDAYDVGSAIGAGLALAVAARKNAQNNAISNALCAAVSSLEAENYEAAIAQANKLLNNADSEVRAAHNGGSPKGTETLQ